MSEDFQAYPSPLPPTNRSTDEVHCDRSVRTRERAALPVRQAVVVGIGVIMGLSVLFIMWHSLKSRPSAITEVCHYRSAGETAVEGDWIVTDLIIDGRIASDEEVSQSSLRISWGEEASQRALNIPRDANFVLALPRSKCAGWCSADFRDDVHEIAFRMGDGRNLLGICHREWGKTSRNDTLVLCLSSSARPTDFTADMGSERTLIFLRRKMTP